MVVVVEQIQRPAILADHLKERRGFIAGEIPAFRHGRHQPNRLLEFGQPTLVDGVAFQEMIPQHLSGPNPELGASLGFDPIPDGNHDIQVKVVNIPLDRSTTFGLNLCKFCTGCLKVEFPFLEDIIDVLGDY